MILILALLLWGAGSTPARADTTVCGPISVDTTWTTAGNNYIVTCLVQVMQGVTLTIEPGVRVNFDAGTGLRIDGELIAHGVTFESNNPHAAPGNWARIFFMATSEDAVFDTHGSYLSGSIIQDSTIVYGGGGFEGAVITYGASPFIQGNTIISSASRGIYATGRSSSHPVVIQENFISANNGGGIYVSAGEVISNTIQGNTSSGQGGGILGSNCLIRANTLLDNTASSHGGGISAEDCTLIGNTISGNTSNDYGGGIYASGGIVNGNTVKGNLSLNNHALGGGIYITSGNLIDNTIDGNTARNSHGVVDWGDARGGGIYASLSSLSGNIVTNNSATGVDVHAYGGGIYASGGTISANTISGNTTTTETDSRFVRGGGVYAEGGTLSGNTIRNNSAAGAVGSLGGGVYSHINTTQGNTLTGNSANQGGAIFAYQGTVNANTILTNTTALSGTLFIERGTATLNILHANSAVAGGALYGLNATLTGNTAEDNHANFGGGIYTVDSTVRGNTLHENQATSDGGGIFARRGTVTNNTLTGNSVPSFGHGSGAYLSGVTDFSYNDVFTNTASGGTSGGVSMVGQPLVQYNNLYGNLPYDAEVLSSLPVTGTLNYWGPSACTAIPGQIYDGRDAPGRGLLAYAPSLYSPVPVAQMAVPGDLSAETGASGVTLHWDAIPTIPAIGCRVPGVSAPDWGYRLYYGSDPCGPFEGQGLALGNSPVDLGQVTSLVLEGIPGTGLNFTVTAYDYLGREGAFSNPLWIPGEGAGLYLPFLRR